MIARFQVIGRFDKASRVQKATVEIDRDSLEGTMVIRPYRRRHVFTTTLAACAQLAVERQIKRELAEKKAAKRKARGSR
jgi:hypothetical protein